MRSPALATFWVQLNRALTFLVVLFLIAPVIIVVIISFSSAQFLTFPPPGFSLQWYSKFFANPSWTSALATSLKVLVLSSVFAMISGTAAAYALWQSKSRLAVIATAIVMAPLVVPAIVTGAAMYMAFRTVGAIGSLFALTTAHIVLTTPYVFVSVSTALKVVDPRLVAAAATLGAAPTVAFRRVVLPQIAPAMFSGLLFAAVMSFDELIVSLFLSTPRTRTITVQMWSDVTGSVDPTLAAVAALLFAVSLLALALNYAVMGFSASRRRAKKESS